MDIINKFLPIVLSILMSINISGCVSNDKTVDTAYAETEKGVESNRKSEDGQENTKINRAIKDVDNRVYDDECLPPNMTMDDLMCALTLNGKTVSMPTSINKLKEIDDNFSFEWESFGYYKTEEDAYNDRNLVYNVMYNGENVNQVGILKSEEAIDYYDIEIHTFMIGFDKSKCDAAGLSVEVGGIGFDSCWNDVIEKFGNRHKIHSSKQKEFTEIDYLFRSDDKLENVVEFSIDDNTDKVIYIDYSFRRQ